MMSDNTTDQAALRAPVARSSAGNGVDQATTDVPQDIDTSMTQLPCSTCGVLWNDAWGTTATFVCPECMANASATKAITCSCGCAFYEHYPYDGACRSCNCPEFRGCDLPRETNEYTITIHRSTLIPGGRGARIGFSDDFPGKQFLILPEEVKA